MKIIHGEDLTYLQNKYHRTDEPFNPYNRMAYHGYEYDPATGMTDEEIDAGLSELSEKIASLSHQEQKAMMVAYVLEHTRIDINQHDYFFGMYSWGRLITKHSISKWYTSLVEENCKDAAAVLEKEERAGMNYGGLDYDHTVPDWDALMTLGIPGILERAKACYQKLEETGSVSPKQEAFYRGTVIEYQAIIDFIDRLVKLAEQQTHEKAAVVAESLRHLRDGAPQTTLDAMELIYLYFMISECVDNYQVRSLGCGLDNTLYPFYKQDLEKGVITQENFTNYLSYFLMQWSAIGNYWGQPFYLGGTNVDGTTKVNEVSYLILETYRELALYNPKIQIKASESTPKPFIMLALDMIRSGISSIVFCNEHHVIQAIMARGGTYEDGCEAVISGCYEYNKKNNSLCISLAYPNLTKPVLLALDNGLDRTTGEQIGPRTGEIETLTSFSKVYEAYLAQLKATFTDIFDALFAMEDISGEINPSLLYSATLSGCIQTMTDALDSGVENDCGVVLGGIGSAVDSLMAIHYLVFEKHIVTLAELNEALHNNWAGYEKLRRLAQLCPHKYGNGDPMADAYANAIYHFVASDIIGSRRTAHGGRVVIEGHSARAFINLGENTLATPDGRISGEELSKNLSPAQGVDRKGVTALIRSATAIDSNLFEMGGCLDVMMHPTAVQGKEGLDVFYNVLMSYIRQNGQSVHFNILDAAQLRDAQEHPEKYPNLQIRVCGWNALWNNMPKVEQDAYLKRAENIQ